MCGSTKLLHERSWLCGYAVKETPHLEKNWAPFAITNRVRMIIAQMNAYCRGAKMAKEPGLTEKQAAALAAKISTIKGGPRSVIRELFNDRWFAYSVAEDGPMRGEAMTTKNWIAKLAAEARRAPCRTKTELKKWLPASECRAHGVKKADALTAIDEEMLRQCRVVNRKLWAGHEGDQRTGTAKYQAMRAACIASYRRWLECLSRSSTDIASLSVGGGQYQYRMGNVIYSAHRDTRQGWLLRWLKWWRPASGATNRRVVAMIYDRKRGVREFAECRVKWWADNWATRAIAALQPQAEAAAEAALKWVSPSMMMDVWIDDVAA
jgi:hypothetical protein